MGYPLSAVGEIEDDIAQVADDGTVRPVGARAISRLQARAGAYHVRPAPPHLLFLRGTGEGRPCLLSGEVRSAGALCDILSFTGHTGWHGELVVQEDDSSRSLFFDQGHVVGAQSNVVRERLGEVLYRYGVLTREQVTACGDASASGAMRFGEAAVKLGHVTRERLFALMAHQTEEIFYASMVVERAMFYFLEGFDEAQLSSRQKLSVSTLVREGIRRMHETRFFRARVPSEAHVPVRTDGAAAGPPDALGVFAAIDGKRSIADICRVVGASEFDVTRAVFQMLQNGQVALKPPPLAVKAAVDVFNRAIALILRELDAMDEGDGVRTQLATFAAQSADAALLAGAGPDDDGTFDGARVAENVARAPSREAAEEQVAGRLHEIASYALFLARPHLRRVAAAPPPGKPRLSVRVAEMLEPIAPRKGRAPGKDR